MRVHPYLQPRPWESAVPDAPPAASPAASSGRSLWSDTSFQLSLPNVRAVAAPTLAEPPAPAPMRRVARSADAGAEGWRQPSALVHVSAAGRLLGVIQQAEETAPEQRQPWLQRLASLAADERLAEPLTSAARRALTRLAPAEFRSTPPDWAAPPA